MAAIDNPISETGDADLFEGEPLAVQLQLQAADGTPEDHRGRSFALTLYRPGTPIVTVRDAVLIASDTGDLVEGAVGTIGLYPPAGLRYQIAELLGTGKRAVFEDGVVRVRRAPTSVPQDAADPIVDGPVTRFDIKRSEGKSRTVIRQRGARGLIGRTPDLTLTVETIAPGGDAAVEMGGTPEAPTAHLSIPLPADSVVPGPSAYDVAVDEGFTGTEAEWLQSLRPTTAEVNAALESSEHVEQLTTIVTALLSVSPPIALTRPVMTGTAVVGGTLTIDDPGSFLGGASFAYQWRRDSAVIAGATAAAYTLVLADAGTAVVGGRIASNANGSSAPNMAESLGFAPPVFTTQPSVSPANGPRGQIFTAGADVIVGATGSTRRWLLNGTPVGTGATCTAQADGALVQEVTAAGLGGNVVATTPASMVGVQSFAPLKAKLAAGQNATMFVNADSTGYSDHGPFYMLAAAIGEAHNATIVLRRWAEWQETAATGPKAYAAPVTLRTGMGPTLTVYLAALPGAVAGAMWDASRKATAIDAIPTPDIAILHHGHNMQSFEVPMANNYSLGAGIYLNVVGLTSTKWPGVPQLATTQNPWRDNALYDKVRLGLLLAASAHPTLSIVDTYQSFIAANKAATLYRDNLHPSDSAENAAGAQLVADALFSYYSANVAAAGFQTVSWPARAAANLMINGDLTTWTAANPTGWTSLAGGLIAKDTVNVVGAAPWSMSLAPAGLAAGNQNSGVNKALGSTERAAIAGKTISVAVLVSAAAGQQPPYGGFICRTLKADGSGSELKSFPLGGLSGVRDGLMWMVASGIPCHTDTATEVNASLRIYPAFGLGAPTVNTPLKIHRAMIVEGALPAGGLA